MLLIELSFQIRSFSTNQKMIVTDDTIGYPPVRQDYKSSKGKIIGQIKISTSKEDLLKDFNFQPIESSISFPEESALKVSKFGGLCTGGLNRVNIKRDIFRSEQLANLCAREPFVKQHRRQT
jgi:hypothetical protein